MAFHSIAMQGPLRDGGAQSPDRSHVRYSDNIIFSHDRALVDEVLRLEV